MRLSDIMSAMQLAHYAEIGLLLFVAAFASVVAWLVAGSEKEQWERARHIPIEEDALVHARNTHREGHQP